jgi:hypothetical protein
LSNVWMKAASVMILATLLLSGCVVEDDVPTDSLFPPQVGAFLRTSGPGPDPETGVDKATYGGTGGEIRLSIKRVGADQIQHALGELPSTATSVGYDPALGQRSGVFFTFGDEYHAAWGNGDWVFVLSAPSEADRLTFLNAYGY